MPVSFVGLCARVRKGVTIRTPYMDVHLAANLVGTITKVKYLPPKFYIEFDVEDTRVGCWIEQKLVELC